MYINNRLVISFQVQTQQKNNGAKVFLLFGCNFLRPAPCAVMPGAKEHESDEPVALDERIEAFLQSSIHGPVAGGTWSWRWVCACPSFLVFVSLTWWVGDGVILGLVRKQISMGEKYGEIPCGIVNKKSGEGCPGVCAAEGEGCN